MRRLLKSVTTRVMAEVVGALGTAAVPVALWAENTDYRDMKKIACGLERSDPSIQVHFYTLMTKI